MASELFQHLTLKIEELASQRDAAIDARERAKQEIADLKRDLQQTREELHRMTLDVEFLTVSRKLADTPQALVEARATVKRMLAKVDKAIELLKEDARI